MDMVKYCDQDFNSACARLPCCSSKGCLKPDLIDIDLSRFSQSVMAEIQKLWGSFFFKIFKILMQILKKQKKILKNFLVSERIASELVSLNCLY